MCMIKNIMKYSKKVLKECSGETLEAHVLFGLLPIFTILLCDHPEAYKDLMDQLDKKEGL